MAESREPVANVDAFIDSPTPTSASGMDFQHHINTYNRFFHLTKWFVIHIALLMVSLYFFIIPANGPVGSLFLAVAVAALVYGIISLPGGRAAAETAAGISDREPDQVPSDRQETEAATGAPRH